MVFTGSLEKMTRDEAKAMAERLGRQGGGLGVEEDRFRRRRSRRRLEAGGGQKLGVQVLTEDEWLKLIGE